MDKIDIPGLAQKMIDAVRGYVAAAEATIGKRVDELDLRISAIPRGEKGDPGDRGEPGLPGSIGEKGEQGSTGPAGEPGAPGEPGPMGPAGPAGESGQKGDPGPSGADGKDGRDGRDGKDGAEGRDAAELSVLASIDEARSYPAGTWAHHAGGLVRAQRATDPIAEGDFHAAGWAVMVEGVAAVVVSQGADPREIEVASMLTSGTKAVAAFTVPAMIYKGVWREGQHEKGDVVTWAGSSWHCERDTDEKPGGGSDAWRLMVKRGADGKDGGARPPAPSAPVRIGQ